MVSVPRRAARFCAVALAAAVLAGCSASADAPTGAAPAPEPAVTATATAAPSGKKAAEAELRRAIRAIKEAGTGSAAAMTKWASPGIGEQRSVTGRYDLDAGRYEYHVGDWGLVLGDVVGADDGRRWISFLDERSKPASVDTWAKYETIGSSADLALLPVLAQVEAVSLAPRPTEGNTITGRLPADVAVLLLGPVRPILTGKISLLAVQGTSTVTIRTDADGKPVWFEVDGSTVRFRVPDGVPGWFRKRIKASYHTVSFTVGVPVEIKLPEYARPKVIEA